MEVALTVGVDYCMTIPPDIQKHPIYFSTKACTALLFHHENDALLVEKIWIRMLEYPFEEIIFKLFHEILFIWNQFEQLMDSLVVVFCFIVKYFDGQGSTVFCLICMQHLFDGVGEQIQSRLVVLETVGDNIGDFVSEE